MPTLRHDGATLHYAVHGAGPPVVLIQGVGVAGRGWQPQIDALKDRFQLLILDNRGVGQSVPAEGDLSIAQMAADTLAVVDAVGWSSAHVAGHSMGGVIAQQLALDAPDRVNSLALLCTFVRGKDAARFSAWLAWIGLRTHLGTRAMRRRAFVEMVMAPDALQDADAWATRLGEVFGRDLADQPSISLTQLRALGRHDTSARLGELGSIPTLVVSAEHDGIALPIYGRQLQEGIPGARFVQIDGSAHACPVDRAEGINALLAAHWGG